MLSSSSVRGAAVEQQQQQQQQQHYADQQDMDLDMEIYRDAVKAKMFKERGNHHFKIGDYDEAINSYTIAVQADRGNPTLYGNRAMALLKNAERHRGKLSKSEPLPELALRNYRAADQDCSKALQLDKDFVKAYYRRGQARKALGMLAEAVFDFEAVLRLEPTNSVAEKELHTLRMELTAKGKAQKRFFSEFRSIPVEPIETNSWIGDLKRIRIEEKNVPPPSPRPELKLATKPTQKAGGAQAGSDAASGSPERMQLDFVVKVPQPAKTAFQFYADWRHLEKFPEKQLEYLFSVGAAGVEHAFRESLEVDVLADIISRLHNAHLASAGGDGDDGDDDSARILSLMKALPNVGRFDTLIMFLEPEESRKVREIIASNEPLLKLWKMT